MALGGGEYKLYNKAPELGTWILYRTVGLIRSPQTTGITAGALNFDWAPDNEVFQITESDFRNRAEILTGHTYNAPENILLREIFRHATTFIGYRLNSGGKKSKATGVGEAKYTGQPGNNITVSVLKNINNEERYDVSTYFNGDLKDTQTVPEASIDEIVLTKGTEKSGTAVETATATFTFNKNQITVQFSNVPEGYKPSVRIKGQVGILAFIPGRMEDMSLSNGNKHIITYSPGAPINGEMTVEAVLTKDKVTVINSCTYTCSVNEAVQTGADATQLIDNDYVIFNKTGLIEENAGYTFTGGSTDTTVTGQDHLDAINALEPYFFNDIFCNSTDDSVKELYVSNIDRMRRQRGKYCRLWVYDYVQADNEAVTSIKNPVVGGGNEGDLVCWAAAYSSGIDLANEMTNKPYDGELEIYTGYPEVQIPMLVSQGNFMFHNIALGDVRTYTDINTFQSYTEERDEQLANNKVIRVLDYIHNEEESEINSQDIGTLKNNPEGRVTLWNRCVDILNDLWKSGVLRDYSSSDIEVSEIESDRYAVHIKQSVNIEGTVRRVYVDTLVLE